MWSKANHTTRYEAQLWIWFSLVKKGNLLGIIWAQSYVFPSSNYATTRTRTSMTSTSTSSSILFLEEGKAKGAPFGHKHSQVSGAWARQSWWKFNFIPENTHTHCTWWVQLWPATYPKDLCRRCVVRESGFALLAKVTVKVDCVIWFWPLAIAGESLFLGGRVTLQFALLCTPALFRSTNERKEELSSYVLMLEMSFGAWE